MFDNAKLHIYMNMISDTELILTDDKKIYHLNLSKDQIADDIILVGDPGRVNIISSKSFSSLNSIEARSVMPGRTDNTTTRRSAG